MYRHNLVNLSAQQAESDLRLQQMFARPIYQSPDMIPGPVQPVVLDSSTAMRIISMGHVMCQEKALMARNDIWHRILILRGGMYDKETVLKSIIKAVNPADLIPVKYQVVHEDSCFIARNCDKALEQLCKLSLIVQCTDGNPLVLSITLGYASIHDLKINIQPILLTVLQKRYNTHKKLLMLDHFHKDPEIYHTVYCPLSQCRTMSHVLKLAKSSLGSIEYLYLQNNELSSLGTLDHVTLKGVKFVDLRNNNLLQIELLAPLKVFQITELWLDGNPLCENYSSAAQYVEAARKYCPHLQKLDGVNVNTPGLPLIFKTYVKNWKRRKLVDQFVIHFFSAYDSKDRNILKGLYDNKAKYSTTVGTPTSPTSKKYLEPFGSENRNLLIFGKNSQQLLHCGQDEILRVLRRFPATQHIQKSFCYDLMYDNNGIICIAVEGLFKLVNLTNQLFSFNRTFILCEEEEDEYKIINDQYHVYLPVHGIDTKTYKIDKHDDPPVFQPTCLSPSEKENMCHVLHENTTMNFESCEKYLTETNWDLRKAISNFILYYKNGQIPKDNFEYK